MKFDQFRRPQFLTSLVFFQAPAPLPVTERSPETAYGAQIQNSMIQVYNLSFLFIFLFAALVLFCFLLSYSYNCKMLRHIKIIRRNPFRKSSMKFDQFRRPQFLTSLVFFQAPAPLPVTERSQKRHMALRYRTRAITVYIS